VLYRLKETLEPMPVSNQSESTGCTFSVRGSDSTAASTFCTRWIPNCSDALPPSIRAMVDSATFASVNFSIASHALVVS
jgi:hypothetical protein